MGADATTASVVAAATLVEGCSAELRVPILTVGATGTGRALRG